MSSIARDTIIELLPLQKAIKLSECIRLFKLATYDERPWKWESTATTAPST